MSHFTVLVIGEDIEGQLSAYQENNMGDRPRKYLEFTAVGDEYLEEYNTQSVPRIKLPSGETYYPWDKQFKVKNPNDPFSDIEVYPEGSEEVEIPLKDLYSSFEVFMEEYQGYTDRDESGRYGYWSNPDAKWDWYLIGGRWTGFFKIKPISLLISDSAHFDSNGFSAMEILHLASIQRSSPEKFEAILKKYQGKEDSIRAEVGQMNKVLLPWHKVGQPGLMTPSAKLGYADQLIKRAIDLAGMQADAQDRANETYDKFEAATAGLEVAPTWEEVRKQYSDIKEAREVYNEHPWVKALREAKLDPWRGEPREAYFVGTGGRDEYVKKAMGGVLQTFAIVKDGKWYERGSMGWWGCVSGEKDDAIWAEEFQKMWDELPEDTLITVVDCHI
jgi:hypothetical protein